MCVFPSVHAAVIAINEAVDRGHLEETAEALRNPNALLSDLQEALMSIYQEMLHQAKRRKEERAANRVRVRCMICLAVQKGDVSGPPTDMKIRADVEMCVK